LGTRGIFIPQSGEWYLGHSRYADEVAHESSEMACLGARFWRCSARLRLFVFYVHLWFSSLLGASTDVICGFNYYVRRRNQLGLCAPAFIHLGCKEVFLADLGYCSGCVELVLSVLASSSNRWASDRPVYIGIGIG
jgi:hypothetical protein